MQDGYSLFVSNLKATQVLQRSNFQLKVYGQRDRPQCAHMALMPSLRRRTALNYAVVSSWVVLEKSAAVPSKENGAFSSSAQPQPLQTHATRVRTAHRLRNANRTGGLILIGLGHPLTGTGTGTGTGAEWRGVAWRGVAWLTSTRLTNP